MLFRVAIDEIDQSSLGWLVHKKPPRQQSFSTPRATATMTWIGETAIELRLDPDLDALSPPYIHPRAYTAGEELSQAITSVFGSALRGVCPDESLVRPYPMTVTLAAVNCGDWLERFFGPLGWAIDVSDQRGEWGVLTLTHQAVTVADMLSMVRVGLCLNRIAGWVNSDRMDAWLTADWLEHHPHRTWILNRLSKGQRGLYEEPRLRLHQQRGHWLVDVIASSGASSAVDAGCGRGEFGAQLIERGIRCIGLEASAHLAERAGRVMRTTVGSIAWFDSRLAGQDAWMLSEVIEHMPMSDVQAWATLMQTVYQPAIIALSTPNHRYNEIYGVDGFRHRDHRWEWTEPELRDWLDGWHQRGWGSVWGGVGEEVTIEQPEQPSFWMALVRPDWELPTLSPPQDVTIREQTQPGGAQ